MTCALEDIAHGLLDAAERRGHRAPRRHHMRQEIVPLPARLTIRVQRLVVGVVDRRAERVDGLRNSGLPTTLLDQLGGCLDGLRPRLRRGRRVGHATVVLVDPRHLIGQRSVECGVGTQVALDRRGDPIELLLDLALGVLEPLAQQHLSVPLGEAFVHRPQRIGGQLTALIDRLGDARDALLGRSAGSVQEQDQDRGHYGHGQSRVLRPQHQPCRHRTLLQPCRKGR